MPFTNPSSNQDGSVFDFDEETFVKEALHMFPLASKTVVELRPDHIPLITPFMAAQNSLSFDFEEALCDNHNYSRDFRATPFAPDPYRDDGSFANQMVGGPQPLAAFYDVGTMLPRTNPWRTAVSYNSYQQQQQPNIPHPWQTNRYSDNKTTIGKAPLVAFQAQLYGISVTDDQNMRAQAQHSNSSSHWTHRVIRRSKPLGGVAELDAAEDGRKPTHERYNICVACENCHRQKVRCDTKKPCGRCVKSGRAEFCKDRPQKRSGRKPKGNGTQQPPSASGSSSTEPSSPKSPRNDVHSFEETSFPSDMKRPQSSQVSKKQDNGASQRVVRIAKKRFNPDVVKPADESTIQKRKKLNHSSSEVATTSRRRSRRKRSRAADSSITNDYELSSASNKKRVMDPGLDATGNIEQEPPIERQFSFLPDNSDFFDKFPVIFNDFAFTFGHLS